MMNKILFLVAVALMVSVTPANASTSEASTTTIESSVVKPKPPKRNKKSKGFNYGAHAKKNKKAGQRAGKKYKRSGRDLTQHKCR